MKVRIGKFLQRDSGTTLGTLLEEARGLTADHPAAQKLKDEVVRAVKDAHEIHHIAFEQRL
jgi:hypothetical protein